jgi:hypothetical protein
VKNRRKTIGTEEKLDVISQLEKGERTVDIYRMLDSLTVAYIQFMTMLTEVKNVLCV